MLIIGIWVSHNDTFTLSRSLKALCDYMGVSKDIHDNLEKEILDNSSMPPFPPKEETLTALCNMLNEAAGELVNPAEILIVENDSVIHHLREELWDI